MKRSIRISACAPALVSLMLSISTSCKPSAEPASSEASGGVDRIARGEYLVNILACDDCHTPKIMGPQGPQADMSRRLSGHPEGSNLPAPPTLPPGPWAAIGTMDLTAWSGPWGISYASNITPDQDTGMGIWTEDMFIKAMRTGKHMGVSRPILPPMPWTYMAKLTDEDLNAVYAYLRTVPAITNHVPDPVIAPPPAAPEGEAK